MGRGSSHSSGGGIGGGGGGGKGNKEKGLELYRRFVEGESTDIHELFGVDSMYGRELTPDEQAIRDLETVFSPAESDMVVYKGMPVTDEDIEQIRSGSYNNKTISSTTFSKAAAETYADNADGEYTLPMTMKIKIKKGTKVADARKILGKGGMKEFEQEVTVWKGTKWKFSNLKEHIDRYGDTRYTVDVIVN